MQRVLFEILRRSQVDNPEHLSVLKRKLDNTTFNDDAKFAEQRYDRETRGSRPGRIDWTIKKKRTKLEWHTAQTKRMHTSEQY
jgi:hypothetical protein